MPHDEDWDDVHGRADVSRLLPVLGGPVGAGRLRGRDGVRERQGRLSPGFHVLTGGQAL